MKSRKVNWHIMIVRNLFSEVTWINFFHRCSPSNLLIITISPVIIEHVMNYQNILLYIRHCTDIPLQQNASLHFKNKIWLMRYVFYCLFNFKNVQDFWWNNDISYWKREYIQLNYPKMFNWNRWWYFTGAIWRT